MKRIPLIIFIQFSIYSLLLSQKNTSQKANYQHRDSQLDANTYVTQYDDGYVVLVDNTKLTGKISLRGDSYEQLKNIVIKTNSGNKHSFQLMSLSEFGLEKQNDLINDTPSQFSWYLKSKKTLVTKRTRIGSAAFGYVKTKEGKLHEGRIVVREEDGFVVGVSIKGNSNLDFEASQIINFGVKIYEDENFEGDWSLLQWTRAVYITSSPFTGYIVLKDGSKKIGTVILMRSGSEMKKITVTTPSQKKPLKYNYEEVASYGATLTVDELEAMVNFKNLKISAINPKLRFHSGEVILENGTIRTGLVARSSLNDIANAYYAKDNNSTVEIIDDDEILSIEQDIPEQQINDYKLYVYNRTHIKGQKIQSPQIWSYDKKTSETYITNYQPGAIIVNGERKIGALSVKKMKNGKIVRFVEAGTIEKINYGYNKLDWYGLIEVEAVTKFPEELYELTGLCNCVPSAKKGFIKLLGTNEIIEGELEIFHPGFSDRTGEDVEEKKVFRLTVKEEKTRYKEANIVAYGIRDVSARLLEQSIITSEKKELFHRGSFKLSGKTKEGWIAWAKPDGAGVYDAFFYAESMGGVANAYYLNESISDITQQDEIIQAKAFNNENKYRGYVMNSNNEKIEGEIQLNFNKAWFPIGVTVFTSGGEIQNYTNNGSLQSIVIDQNGTQVEFVNFENEYTEVLNRIGDWVEIRNPHPREISIAADKLANTSGTNILISIPDFGSRAYKDMMNEVNQLYSKKLLETWTAQDHMRANTLFESMKHYWNYSEHFEKIFVKEFVVFNTKTNHHAIFNKSLARIDSYIQVKGLLMGVFKFLELEKGAQHNYFKMDNSKSTLKFLRDNYE